MSNADMQQRIPAGYYDDGHGAMRWWNGVQWTEYIQGASNAPRELQPRFQVAPTAPVVVTNVTAPRKVYKTSHGFHLLMSIFTLGAWLPVWLIVGVYNSAKA